MPYPQQIVPRPKSVAAGSGYFQMNRRSCVALDGDVAPQTARALAEPLRRMTRLPWPIGRAGGGRRLALALR